MIYRVVSVRDRVANVYNTPFCSPHPGVAIRNFTDEINRAAEDNMLYKHADDYELYDLGSYDDETGSFTQDGPPRQLILGRDCKKVIGNAS